MSTEHQRIVKAFDAWRDADRPILVHLYPEARAQRKRLEDEKTVVLKRLAFIESDLEAARKEERRLARIVLGMDTVTKT